MTAVSERLHFKRAVYFSLGAHFFFVLFILISPHLPKPARKGMIHYIPLNMVVAGGGGGGGREGGGGGAGKPAAGKPAPPAKKETLRDLTIPQKVKPESKPTMRYPVEKPAKEPKTKVEKKAAITRPETSLQGKTAQSGTPEGVEGETGMGTGLRIGGGEGPGGPGYGSGGLANFPYTYYLNIITDRVSSNWFSSLVDPGVSGSFQTVIYFRIEKSGQVSDIKIEQSSGVTPLDLSAVRAVKASAPFPPLPREYEDAYLGIHLIFEHSK